MLKYGRKIIQYLFKKRQKCHGIRVVFASRSEADCDRSHIRMFEIGLSSEQYGDYEQGTRAAAQTCEGERLIGISRTEGTFVPKEKWGLFGDRKRLPSGESVVYLNEDETVITKVRNPFAKSIIKSLHAQDTIYEHLIHNILFPSTRYNFIGISEDFDGIRIILQQKYLSNQYSTPIQSDIDDYLIQGLGLQIERRYYYANDYIAITDVSAESDNVLSDGSTLYFIDPIIKFKKPAIEVLDYYYSLLK